MVERDIDATPTKRVLEDSANRISEKACVSELVDNCIDFWTTKGRKKPLEIRIWLQRGKRTADGATLIGFKMKWNMAVPEERLGDVVTLGSQSFENEDIIGLWGQGAKVAMHGIARGWRLISTDAESTHVIECPSNWIRDRRNWKLKSSSTPSSGTKEETVFESTVLHEGKWKEQKVDEEFYDPKEPSLEVALRNYLSGRYSEFGKLGAGVSLFLDDSEIELNSVLDREALKRDFLWIPGYEPHIDTHFIETPPNEEDEPGRLLTVKIFIGLHSNPEKEQAGAYVYGNNRMFLAAAKGKPLYNDYDPYQTRVRMYVFMEGKSKDIPWGIPEKDGLNREHYILPELAKRIRKSVGAYLEIVKLESTHLALYSLVDDMPTLLQKAKLADSDARAIGALLKRIRELNDKSLRFYSTSKGTGRPTLMCLDKDFRHDIAKLIDMRKEDKISYAQLHFELAENAIALEDFQRDVAKLRKTYLKNAVEVSFEDEPGEEGSEEKDKPKRGRPKKNKDDVNYYQASLDSFLVELDSLGDILDTDNRSLMLVKVTKLVKRMREVLKSKSYMTAEKKIILKLLQEEQ